MSRAAEISDRAAELRRSFDMSFAAPARRDVPAAEDMLVIHVAEVPYAIRLACVLGLHADCAITPLPTPVPELLGIAALRGAIVPVYSLGGLLGHAVLRTPRWFVTTRAGRDGLLALAFECFVRQARIAAEQICPAPAPGLPCVRAAVRVDDRLVPLLDIPALVADIERRVRAGTPQTRSSGT